MQSGLLRASSGLAEGMRSAIERTTSMKSTISRNSSAGAREILAALQDTANGDLGEASEKVLSELLLAFAVNSRKHFCSTAACMLLQLCCLMRLSPFCFPVPSLFFGK